MMRGSPSDTAVQLVRYDTVAMNALTLFGLFAVSAMLVFYALESRCHWFVLVFAVSCSLGSAYGFLPGAWPFGLVEAVWSAVALRRWLSVRRYRMLDNVAALSRRFD
jgi:hypothetical protein